MNSGRLHFVSVGKSENKISLSSNCTRDNFLSPIRQVAEDPTRSVPVGTKLQAWEKHAPAMHAWPNVERLGNYPILGKNNLKISLRKRCLLSCKESSPPLSPPPTSFNSLSTTIWNKLFVPIVVLQARRAMQGAQ